MAAPLTDVDPFDLPEWLGTSDVVWRSDGALDVGHVVEGRLTGPDQPDLACDLLAVDQAYPTPVADDRTRLRAHQAWRHGQVLVGERDGRLTLVVPGTQWGPELVLETLRRFARAVGARGERFAALLRVGG